LLRLVSKIKMKCWAPYVFETKFQYKMIHFIFSGGTLGLFLGMSLMTVIEILIWILKLLYKIMTSQKNVRREERRS
jgi:hypothetical protein